jgi:general secretion pathway protein K
VLLVRRGRRRGEQRGIAMLMVLAAITVLTVMLGEFQDTTSAELGSALSERDGLRAEYAAKSAINLSRLLIAAEPTIRSKIGPLLMMALRTSKPPQLAVWEYAPQILGAFNDEEGSEAFSKLASVDMAEGRNLGLDGARFEVEIVDEDSKINLNLAARGSAFFSTRLAAQIAAMITPPRYDPLFEQRGADGNYDDRMTVCSALIDWVDPDQEVFPCVTDSDSAQSAAAEDSYYQLLPRPYERKNAAYDSLEEVHMVRGITDDFWATFFEPEFDNPRDRVVTVWGQEGVNLNSTGLWQMLAALCSPYGQPTHPICVDPTQQATLITAMGLIKNLLPGVPLFGSPEDFVKFVTGKGQLSGMLEQFGIQPFQLNSETELKKMFTMESKLFSIYATGIVKSGQRETRVRIHTVVDTRGAPPPGENRQAADVAEALGLDTGSTPTTQEPPDLSGLPEGATEEAIAKALKPNPAGNIVYYRIN